MVNSGSKVHPLLTPFIQVNSQFWTVCCYIYPLQQAAKSRCKHHHDHNNESIRLLIMCIITIAITDIVDASSVQALGPSHSHHEILIGLANLALRMRYTYVFQPKSSLYC